MKTLKQLFSAAIAALAIVLVTAGAAYATTYQVSSGPKTSGSGAAFSEEYRIEAHAPAGKKIISHHLELGGDRRCNAWSTCRVIVATDTLVVYGFSLQGHNEGTFFRFRNPNNGERDSTAYLTFETN